MDEFDGQFIFCIGNLSFFVGGESLVNISCKSSVVMSIIAFYNIN